MDDNVWAPLTAELDRWQEAKKVAPFWLRDDDAVEPTPALAQLLALSNYHGVPLAIAVIPAQTGQALAHCLDGSPLARVCVHGWSHANHASEGDKKQELGAQRPLATIIAELDAGFDRVKTLHPGRFDAVLVPPWNRIAPPLIPALPALGYRALSVFGPEKPAALSVVNTHVDLMDWHGTRGARVPSALVTDIVKRLQQIYQTGGVMGLLTHHLVHDVAGWDFLDGLFALTARHPACRWMALADMLDQR